MLKAKSKIFFEITFTVLVGILFGEYSLPIVIEYVVTTFYIGAGDVQLMIIALFLVYVARPALSAAFVAVILITTTLVMEKQQIGTKRIRNITGAAIGATFILSFAWGIYFWTFDKMCCG